MKMKLFDILRLYIFAIMLIATSSVMSLNVAPPPLTTYNDTVCYGMQVYQFGYDGLNLGAERFVITSLSNDWTFEGGKSYVNTQGFAKSSGTITMPIPGDVREGVYNFSFLVVDSLYYCQSDTLYFSLIVFDTARGIDELVACDSLTWVDGITYKESTNLPRYTYYGGAASGCDSIVTLNLTINRSYRYERDIVSCDSYLWSENNQLYTQSTVDSVILTSSKGCDSTIVMNLTINPTTYGVDTVIVVRRQLNEGYQYHHETFYDEGDYTVTLSAANMYNCDSVISLSLLATDTLYSPIDTVYICAGTTYTFNGQEYSTTGLYRHYLLSVDGSDSVARMYLHVNDTLRGDLYATICVGATTEPVEINGKTYTYTENVAGEYTHKYQFKNSDGCDTIVTMHLTVLDHPTLTLTPDTSLCYGNNILLRASSPTANSYLWEAEPVDTTLIGQNTDSNVVVRPLISTTYTVTADIAPYNCKTTASTFVYVTQPLVAKLYSNPREVDADNLEVFFRDMSVGNIGRAWEFLSNNPTHRYHRVIEDDAATERYFIMPCDMDTGEVTLRVWNELYEQCVDTARVKIAINCNNDVWIPNTFTPDEDQNNNFEIFSDKVAHFEMYIYSRAGLLVYEVSDLQTHNNDRGWNGRIRNVGEKCPQANYVYLIRFSTKKDPNTIREKAGSILLLR